MSSKKSQHQNADTDSTKPKERPDFPVVAIGASAGGLEALNAFFADVPANTGCAFLVVSHHSAQHPSLLPDILTRYSKMLAIEAQDGVAIEPNCIYTNPSSEVFVSIVGGQLALLSEAEVAQLNQPQFHSQMHSVFHPIDHLFRQLAFEYHEQAVAIILSGSGTDGSLGLKAIKEENGLVMVQDPVTARFAGMPASAIATEMVDVVLPPEEMASQLLSFVQDRQSLRKSVGNPLYLVPTWALQQIYVLLRARTGHDFSAYKSSTLQRRIERRMGLHGIDNPIEYIEYLRSNEAEQELLFKELLIRVTGFFRDPLVWQECERQYFPELIKQQADNEPLRVWVPGCATGEEAYTIAMVFKECMAALDTYVEVQIFATDLDLSAVEIARKGVYPDGIAAEIPERLLKRYFTINNSHYLVRKDLREMIVFAPQNVIKDPPFTRMDLISCRNMLIYMQPELQRQLLPVFHYALRSKGLMILGPSESVNEQDQGFQVLNKKWKVYRKVDQVRPKAPSNFRLTLPQHHQPVMASPVATPIPAARSAAKDTLSDQVIKFLANRFAPAAAITNDCGDIFYLHGKTGHYLEPSEGRPRSNLLEMARDGLRLELSSLLRQAASGEVNIAERRVQHAIEGQPLEVIFSAERILAPEALRGLMMVTFRLEQDVDMNEVAVVPSARPVPDTPSHKEQLERELQLARESYQTIVEELESSNEELRSTNEELQSTNEELQSTNEELETSREEMQSLYEELSTVNSELQSKVETLSQANDDMQNLLNSADVATIFLDNRLCIKRFTEQAQQLVALRSNDRGRPVSELAWQLRYDDLVEDAQGVLRTLKGKELELRALNGDWYLMRMLPYRTQENVIDGLVLSFIDISRTKQAQQQADVFSATLAAMPHPLLVLDQQLTVAFINPAWQQWLNLNHQNGWQGTALDQLPGADWSSLQAACTKALETQQSEHEMPLSKSFPEFRGSTPLLSLDPLSLPQHPGRYLLLTLVAGGNHPTK